MHASRDDLLAGAGLAENEERQRGLGDALEHAEHAAHLRRCADELAEAIGVSEIDLVLRARLDDEPRLADGDLGLCRQDDFANPERADERAVRAAEVADENTLVHGAELAVNG